METPDLCFKGLHSLCIAQPVLWQGAAQVTSPRKAGGSRTLTEPPPSQFDQDNLNGKRAPLCPCGPRRSVSVPPRCTAPGCLTIIQSWLGPRPRLAALWHGHTYRPHVPATRTGPSPAHTLVPPLSSPRCPAGTPEHNSKGKNFFRGGGKSCSPQDVMSQARQRVSLLSYKQ